MSDDESRRRAVEQSSDWLDSDTAAEDPAIAEPPPGPLVDPQWRAHVADQQLISAMLLSLSDKGDSSNESRVRRVMDQIERESAADGLWRWMPAHMPRWPAAVALAACLTLFSALWWVQVLRESRASEVLLEIRDASRAVTDRVYSVRRRSGAQRADAEIVGTLYLRGLAGFVLECGDVVLGRSGDRFWFVSPNGEVVLSVDFDWLTADAAAEDPEVALLKQLSVDSRQIPLMELSAVVELIQSDYDVTFDPGDSSGPRRLDQVVGTRRGEPSALPDRIRLDADRETRIVERAELTWLANAASPGRGSTAEENSLVLELSTGRRVEPHWYEHESHHAIGAPIRHAASGNAESHGP